MQTWLIAFAKSIFYDLVGWVTRKLSTYVFWQKVEKKDDERVKKNEESSASTKPHEEKVKDANEFLNTIGKP
jgi:hypothetical protein